VVASDIAAVHEVAGDAAELVPPGDVDAWAGVLRDLLGDASRRAVLVEKGRERALGFSWERTVSLTVDVYKEALGAN